LILGKTWNATAQSEEQVTKSKSKSKPYMKPPTNTNLKKGASGSTSDRRHVFKTFAENFPTDPVDVIIGDWMPEANMIVLAEKKAEGNGVIAYEPTCLHFSKRSNLPCRPLHDRGLESP
jgi:hypothetical protein